MSRLLKQISDLKALSIQKVQRIFKGEDEKAITFNFRSRQELLGNDERGRKAGSQDYQNLPLL